jgi:uncharacterized protein
MKQIFVDTGAWYALADPGDANHQAALQFRDTIAGKVRLVTSNYVMDELYTLLLLSVGYPQTVSFQRKLDILVQRKILEIVWVSEQIAEDAWEIFERFNVDKHWSFTDCVSYAIMQQRQITEAFAFDHHFAQMGVLRKP